MKIHEYQAKDLLDQYQIAIPNGIMVESAEDAKKAAETIGGRVVVKAQIHAGGRGKGGGIQIADTPDQVIEKAKQVLGMNLITHQTGPEGRLVQKVLIEEAVEIEKELYLGMVLDRSTASIAIIASEAGGMDIEEVAEKWPDKLIKTLIDPRVGLQPFQSRQIAFELKLSKEHIKIGTHLINSLYKLFIESDASLVEINPLIITKDNRLLAADAKINFDDNALFRHAHFTDLRDVAEEDPEEVEASSHNLSYVKLDGNVGCMVNGAGLAMATMDIIKLHGSMPANFLDVGGAASVERVEKAFNILLSDPNVKTVLINIFGGIVRCDRVAKGLIEAAKRVEINVPIVIRLAGTNSEIAEKILADSSLDFIVAKCLRDAAIKAVAASRGDDIFLKNRETVCP